MSRFERGRGTIVEHTCGDVPFNAKIVLHGFSHTEMFISEVPEYTFVPLGETDQDVLWVKVQRENSERVVVPVYDEPRPAENMIMSRIRKG